MAVLSKLFIILSKFWLSIRPRHPRKVKTIEVSNVGVGVVRSPNEG